MVKKISHPGITLEKMLLERGISQRELAANIDVAHSLLNNILKGKRNINVNIAIALEAAGFQDAKFWMQKNMEFVLAEARNDSQINKKKETISVWKEIESSSLVPLYYFKKQKDLGVNSSDDIDKLLDLYKVRNFKELKNKIDGYDLKYFRKSSKFAENRNNVIAWSMLAEYRSKQLKVNKFKPSNEDSVISELKKCFYSNKDTLAKTEKILAKYGIKFSVLDRPSKTPVEGKSFMSDGNPSIVLSLKYKRLDNFAFTIMHELGHVFLHLTKAKYRDVDFFINNANMTIEEFEADSYAQIKLIDLETWNEFYLAHDDFDDDVIYKFSKSIRVHPAIIRGRICHENPEYYRKRTSINAINQLT